MPGQVIIWDFRLRIADCGLKESLRSIEFNKKKSLLRQFFFDVQN
ncbi:hypothetical protein D1AOALGA4SA_3043 [Olavius algarvensis Delta 1 endosymbiont]|nr:hypothetical protein D1AOALGA4SA_3043 [Olavius algarvensis Delta 1 endosymbiont]